MTRFGDFYDRLSNIILPMLCTMLAILVVEVVRILAGWAFDEIEFFIVMAIQALGLLVVLFWIICSQIQEHLLRKKVYAT